MEVVWGLQATADAEYQLEGGNAEDWADGSLGFWEHVEGCMFNFYGLINLHRFVRKLFALDANVLPRYTEAIPFLYKPHTFSLLHLTHLLFLPQRLPVSRLNSIRSLRLRLTIRGLPYYSRQPLSRTSSHLKTSKSAKLAYPEDTTNWTRCWEIIGSMKGLRELYVVLIAGETWKDKWLSLEEELLAPAKKLEGIRWFEVWLPYEESNVLIDMGETGCRLRKPEGSDEEETEGEQLRLLNIELGGK